MATAGLSFANPFLDKVNVGEEPNPYAPFSPTSSIGMGGLGPSAADMAVTGEALAAQSQFTMPQMRQPPAIAFSPTRNEFFVQGTTFRADDAPAALQAEGLLGGPGTGLPTEGDWEPLDVDAYQQYLSSIRNPSAGRLFAKNFAIGGQQLKQLAGSALQLAGAEQTGGALVESAQQRLEQLSPYQRQFTDVEVGSADRGIVDWFVANLAQQGPMMLESVAMGLAGAAAGSAAAGPGLGTAGGFLAGVFGKKQFKEKVLEAATKYRTGGAAALNATEAKLLKNASALTGAAAANFTGSQVMGAGDIYGEMREQGVGPEDFGARMTALAGSFPYALAESSTEFLLAGRALGGLMAPRAIAAGTKPLARGAELLRRGAVGAGVGAVAEGSTELGQEALVMGLSGQDLTSDEAVNRFINSFAAGAAIGGGLGGIANLRGENPDGTPSAEAKAEVNLLDSAPLPSTELVPVAGSEFTGWDRGGYTPAPPGTSLQPYTQPVTFLGATPAPGVAPLQLGGPAPTAPVTPAGPPTMMVTPEGVAYPDQMLTQTGNVPPGTQPGSQGVLDMFGGSLSAQELNARMQPQAPLPGIPAPVQAPVFDPRQGALQFSGPAPTAGPVNTQMPNQLQAIQDRLRRQQEFAQAQAQQAALIQQQTEALAQQSQNARDLYAMQQAQQAAAVQPSMPMRQAGPTQPVQLPLFTRRQAPVPSRAEGLRRGVSTGLPAGTAEVPQTAAQRRAQVPLLTQEGEPSVAALRAAGVQTKTTPVAPKPRATKTAGARGLKKGAKVAEVTVKETPSAVQKPSPAPVPAQPRAEARKGVGAEVPTQRKAAGEGETRLKTAVKKARVAEKPLKKEAPPAPKAEAASAAAPVLAEKIPPKAAPKLSAEDQWNEERLPGDVAYADLPAAAKAAWETSDRSGAMQVVILDQLSDDIIPMTATERLNYSIAYADEALKTGNLMNLADAMDNIVETAFFTDESKLNKPRIAEAQSYLDDTTFTDAQQAVVNDAFLLLAEGQRLDAYYKGETKGGAVTPWFDYASRQEGLIQRLAKSGVVFSNITQEKTKALLDRGMIATENLPDSTVKALGKGKPSTEQAAGSKPQTSIAVRLADEITKLNKSSIARRADARAKVIADLTKMWQQVQDANLQTPELAAYFDADGKPITNVIDGKLRVGTKKLTKEEVAALETQMREEQRLAQASRERAALTGELPTLEGWDEPDTGQFRTADGQRITKPLGIGRVRLAVNRFRAKLAVKPNIFVYADQADLKAKNPALYKQAVKSWAYGEDNFDALPALGYAFGGDNVIIFADRQYTENSLNFTLAHEVLGHFGFRGLMPQKQFDALMESLYDQSPAIRAAADAAMQSRGDLNKGDAVEEYVAGISKSEAVEEYLADFAAELDVSLIARIWNAIKGALNKLGVEFGDDTARYWVNQARRYVRNGEVSHAFRPSEVFSRMNALEGGLDPDDVGRFALAGTLRGDNMAADLMSDTVGGMPTSMADAAKQFRDLVGDSFDSVDKFKARFFSLLNFRARENPGLAELDRILRNGRGYAMSIKNAANEKMEVVLNRAVSIPGTKVEFAGITEAQTTQVNKMLYDAQRYAIAKLKPADLGKAPLFTIASDGTVVPNQSELDRVYKLGLLRFEQARDGYSYEITYEQEGTTTTEKVQVPGIADLEENGPVWQGYLRTRETLREVEMQLLRARYSAFTQDRDLAFREIGDATTAKKLTSEDQRFLEKMYRKYRDLWVADQVVDESGNPAFNADSIERANDFLVAFNAALIGKGTDRNAAVAAYFEGTAADDAVADLTSFKTRLVLDEENKFLVQNRLKDIIVAEVSNNGADLYTKNTLASGYVPILREGGFQVRVVATNMAGKVVRLKQGYKEQLVYSQVETNSEARNLAGKINEMFGDKTYKVEAYNEDTRQYESMDVRLGAMPETAITEIAAPPELNLNEFVRGLRQFSITLQPQKLKEVVVALTRQNNSARNRLKRAFTPGASPDALKAMSQHIESRASTSAKILMRPKINELMNLNMTSTQKLWNGDKAKLDQLKANYDRVLADPASTVGERVQAKREFDMYNFQYQNTNPKGESARGNQYYNEAAGTLSFLDNNKNVDESDFGSGKVASNIRAYTSLLQLGGSISTGALNYIGAITNGIPYLATYNDKTAFGGGFGLGNSLAAFQKALSQVGLLRALPGIGERGLNTAEFYDDIAASPELQKKFGLTAQEARFMATEIREGEMIPAQSNALVGSARGRTSTGAGQKALDGWMWTFNVTEQGARRGLGLAAYRLQYERSRAAGMTEADAAAAARDFAVSTLRFTVGDYSVMNRPPVWRSGIQSFLYMYKVFVTTSIQMLSRLPRDGQVYMLGALWVLGGALAFPFAEDLEDLIDTIAQALGLKMGSVRAELAKTIDAVAPGMSPYALRGFANAYFDINIADRVSLSNFIPGTGILLSGADVGRELTDIAGPAASMLTGVASSIPRFMQATFTDRVTFVDAFRESPVTMMRALGDTIAYGQAGAVIDKRGYVVLPDVSAGLLAARMLGFYPAEAAEQYGIIRASKRITDYQKETVAGFRAAWIKAKLNNDPEQVRAVEDAVKAWNEGSKGTALEIKKFVPNAQRALREAQRPAKERMLRAAPVAARDDLEQIADLLGYND